MIFDVFQKNFYYIQQSLSALLFNDLKQSFKRCPIYGMPVIFRIIIARKGRRPTFSRNNALFELHLHFDEIFESFSAHQQPASLDKKLIDGFPKENPGKNIYTFRPDFVAEHILVNYHKSKRDYAYYRKNKRNESFAPDVALGFGVFKTKIVFNRIYVNGFFNVVHTTPRYDEIYRGLRVKFPCGVF